MKIFFFLSILSSALAQDLPPEEACISCLLKEEQWAEVCEKCQTGLKNSSTASDRMFFYRSSALASLYQGDFELSAEHALKSYEIACQLPSIEYQVENLCILSSLERIQKKFKTARDWAQKALRQSPESYKARVFFHLAAIESDDPEGNLDEAKEFFLEALSLFTAPGDWQKTIIRLGKVYLQKGDLDEAERMLEKVTSQPRSKRLQMHTEYLAAQIEKNLGNHKTARNYAAHALEKGQQLHSKKDIERIQNFLNNL